MSGSPVLLAKAVRDIERPGFTLIELRELIDAGKVPVHQINGRRGVLIDDVREALARPAPVTASKPRLKAKKPRLEPRPD